MAFEGLAQALLAGIGEVQNRRQRREEQRLRDLQLEGLALENERARRELEPAPEPTIDLGRFNPELAGVSVSPEHADDLLRAWRESQPTGSRVSLSPFLVGPRLEPYRDAFAGIELEESNLDDVIRALESALPEPQKQERTVRVNTPYGVMDLTVSEAIQAGYLKPQDKPARMVTVQTASGPVDLTIDEAIKAGHLGPPAAKESTVAITLENGQTAEVPASEALKNGWIRTGQLYPFETNVGTVYMTLDEATDAGLLKPKQRTYTMNLPTEFAAQHGIPGGGLLTGLTLQEVGQWADRVADWYEKNEPEAQLDLRDLLNFPGFTNDLVEYYRSTYGFRSTVNTPSGPVVQTSYLVPASTWNHILSLHTKSEEAKREIEQGERAQAQQEFGQQMALREADRADARLDLDRQRFALESQIARAREARDQVRFEAEQAAATISLRDLAEMAGFDLSRIPESLQDMPMRFSSTEGLVNAVDRLHDMAQEETAAGSGIDAGDVLRFATDVYNARYAFDFNAPPFDEFLAGEFVDVFEVAKAIAEGRNPNPDALERVLDMDAGQTTPAQPSQAPQRRGFNLASIIDPSNSVAANVYRWVQTLLENRQNRAQQAPAATPPRSSLQAAPALGPQAVQSDIVARPAEPLPFDPELEARDLLEQLRAEGSMFPVQDAVSRLDANRDRIKIATRWTDEQIDQVIQQLLHLMGGEF